MADDDLVFDPAAIVTVLNRHEVDYVAIGAFAAIAQGAPIRPTQDLDITPSATDANLRRLSDALQELGARIRTVGEPDGLPFAHDAASLGRATMWNLQCRHGAFDVAFVPSGTAGYDDLLQGAVVVDLRGQRLTVASIADIIRSKLAAGRPKDMETLPDLEAFRDELHARAESHELDVTPPLGDNPGLDL